MQQRVVNPVRQQAEADVTPGAIYELRVLLRRRDAAPRVDGLGVTRVPIRFLDANGAVLDPRALCGEAPIPGLDPLEVETLPAVQLDDELVAAGLASRFLVAPPDCRRVAVGPLPPDVEMERFEISPVHVLWSGAEAKRFADQLEAVCTLRRSALERRLPRTASAAGALDLLGRVPVSQVAALVQRLAPRGDWRPVLDGMGGNAEEKDFDARMERLRSRTATRLKVGFVGTPRGRERIEGMADVFWLREDRLEEQMAVLRPDLILLEAAYESGASTATADWVLAFSSLGGELPDRGRRLFDAARGAGVPVHLWLSSAANEARTWRGCAEVTDRVICEGQQALPDLSVETLSVEQFTCPTACTMASQAARDAGRILVPTGSDLFQFPDFAAVVGSLTQAQSVITEFHYRFATNALLRRLKVAELNLFADPSRPQQRRLLQAAGLVLLPARSLRSESQLAEIALDAVASGSIPVLFGTAPTEHPLLAALDRVTNPVELLEFQALYRIAWQRERRWRGLMRVVMERHAATSQGRAALLGRDPFPADFDHPPVTSIMVTRRPHLLEQCLENFRKQTWPNKELILVFNKDEEPQPMPELRENERIFTLPASSNIGECLNYAIEGAQGRYWAKMDDDDFYSATYLEETERYFRSTQAEVVGRQSVYFYFAGEDETRTRSVLNERCFRILSESSIAGSTLAADKAASVPPFSFQDRNCADSNWVQRALLAGARVFSGDGTSMVVYRDADESQHTWHLSNFQGVVGSMEHCAAGNLFPRFEEQA